RPRRGGQGPRRRDHGIHHSTTADRQRGTRLLRRRACRAGGPGKGEPPVIRHTVIFRWTADASEAQIEEALRRLSELPSLIPEIRRYEFGRDLGFSDGTWDMAL